MLTSRAIQFPLSAPADHLMWIPVVSQPTSNIGLQDFLRKHSNACPRSYLVKKTGILFLTLILALICDS